jgi:hypothetical protein
MMMTMMMALRGARRLRRGWGGRRGRGRVRCENAGLSDKAEDGSQKHDVFYHRLLLNTVKNAMFRKKLRHLAKERTCWLTTARAEGAIVEQIGVVSQIARYRKRDFWPRRGYHFSGSRVGGCSAAGSRAILFDGCLYPETLGH